MDVELLSGYATSLRPFDSVFIGNTLGVVEGVKVDIERKHKCRNKRGKLCVDGQLIIHVQSNKHLSHGKIELAEPSILYESAIRILKESINSSNGDCSLYGKDNQLQGINEVNRHPSLHLLPEHLIKSI
jgi:hypothetical protein